MSVHWNRGKNGFKNMRVQRSKFLLSISTILLVITVIHTLWAPTMLIRLERSIMAEFVRTNKVSYNVTVEHNNKMLTSKQTMVVKVIHPLLICITSLTARGLSVSVLPGKVPELVKKLNRIDELLTVPSGLCRSNCATLLFFVVVFFTLNIPLMAYHLWQLSFFHSGWGNAWEAFSIFNIFTTFSMELQFITFCYITKSRLVYINEKLDNFVADEFTYDEVSILFRHSKQSIIDSGMYKNMVRKDLTRELSRFPHVKIEAGGSSIRSLRISHILLHDVMDNINGIYQLHILVSIFASISKILFNLYFSIFGFITSTKRLPSKIQRGQMYIVCLWTVFYCLRFLLIVLFAHTTAQEPRKTKRILVKIDHRKFEQQDKEEVKLFWDHLSRREFEFSACGLFNLNMALITSTFSSGITYLVIMAQFH